MCEILMLLDVFICFQRLFYVSLRGFKLVWMHVCGNCSSLSLELKAWALMVIFDYVQSGWFWSFRNVLGDIWSRSRRFELIWSRIVQVMNFWSCCLRGTGIPVEHPEFRMGVLNFPEPEFRLGNRSTGWGIFPNPSFPRFWVFRGIAMLFIDRETFSFEF